MLPRTRAFFCTLIGLQFVAMALLIICSVTAPVFKQIGLSKYNDVTYGVFGYCNGDDCSKASAVYSPVDADSDDSDSDWKMSNKARKSLGKILIITPVAAGLNFLSMISIVVAFIICLASGVSSAVLFTINLVLAAISFLASALVCVVIFLLFYPHITWCTWLLIPAAVLPLVIIPFIFVAHSDAKRDSDDDLEGDELRGIVEQDDVDESQFDSPRKDGNIYREMTGDNTMTSLTEKPLVLPNYGYGNFNKQDSVFKVNTGTTDQSTMDKEKIDQSDLEDEKNSHAAYSAINGDSNSNTNNGQQMNKPYATSLSLASSNYSDKHHHNPYQNQSRKDSRGILEDIIKDSFPAGDSTIEGANHLRSVSDNGSDFTSISQRAPQQQYYPQPVAAPLVHPAPHQQQRLPLNYRSAGPDSSDVLQNNPNFIAQAPRRMHPQQNHLPQQFPQAQQYHPQGQFNAYGNPYQNNYNRAAAPSSGPATSAHYKPAYKKRMNARNLPPASSLGGQNPYAFR